MDELCRALSIVLPLRQNSGERGCRNSIRLNQGFKVSCDVPPCRRYAPPFAIHVAYPLFPTARPDSSTIPSPFNPLIWKQEADTW